MKFACPKCNTRYSISDDKVPPGKVLKFPCKTCGNVVRLRRREGGDQAQILESGPAAVAPKSGEPIETTRIASVSEINKLRDQSTQPTKVGVQAVQRPEIHEDGGEVTRLVSVEQINLLRAAAAEGDQGQVVPEDEQLIKPEPGGELPEWFVLIAGKQRGPMAASAVDAMLSRNEIDRRTFVWKSGMTNWERLSTVERFAGAVTPAAETVVPSSASPLVESTQPEIAMENAAAATSLARRPTEDVTVTDVEEISEGLYEEPAVNGQRVAAAATDVEDITIADEEPQGFYKAETMVVSDARVAETLAAVGAAEGPDSRRAETIELDTNLDISEEGPGGHPNDAFLGAEPARAEPEHLPELPSVSQFDDVSADHPLPAQSGMDHLGDDPNYLEGPPGDSTRVYMATAGIYKKRRNNRIAAVITTLMLILVCGFIVMDMRGLIVLPGMGAVYDVAGVDDPNIDRALERTENKLAAEDLDPKKRAQLESLRRKLLDKSNQSERGNGKTDKHDAKDAGKPAEVKEEAKEGVPSENGTADEHAMAEQLFGDKNKQEANVKLAAPDAIQTPNLPDGLTQEAIYKVINDNNTSMKLCYAEAARKGERLAGKMEVQLTIDASGDVSGADINTAQFKTSTMGQCTVRRVKTWKFPKFNGAPVTVVFPYVLQSAL